MGGKKLILFLFFLFGMVLTSYGQTIPYTYIDPCTGQPTTVQVPSTSGTVTMFYGGQYQTFTYAQLQAGAYDQWVNSINAQFPPGTDPCAGLGGEVTDDFNTLMGTTTAGNVANITSIVQMAAGLANSTSGAANTAGGISSSLSGNGGSSSGGGSNDNNDNGGDGNSSSSNSGSNTGGSTGSSSSSGGNTSTGGNSGSGTSTGGSTGSGSGSSTGGSTGNGGGSTGGSGSSGSGGGNTGGSGSSGSGGGSTGGGNSGSGGSGSGEPSVGNANGSGVSSDNGGNTSSESELGGLGEQSTTSASGGQSESSDDGGGGGGGGRRKSKQEKVGRGALIGAGDVVIIRNSSNIQERGMDNFKFNMSLTHLNSKQTFIKGANLNYQTGENIANITLYGSLKTERNMFIFSNSTMTNFTSDWFNTTSVMDAVRINKITLMGGTNYTYGYLGKGEFSNWSLIGGGFTNFQGGRHYSANIMLLSVYSPYIFYYEGQWYKSGFLLIPLINNDIKVTDKFKWSISFAGVYQYNGSVLNWQLSTGTKILL